MLEFNWACSVLLPAWLDSQALSPVSVIPTILFKAKPVSALRLQLFDLLVCPNPESLTRPATQQTLSHYSQMEYMDLGVMGPQTGSGKTQTSPLWSCPPLSEFVE